MIRTTLQFFKYWIRHSDPPCKDGLKQFESMARWADANIIANNDEFINNLPGGFLDKHYYRGTEKQIQIRSGDRVYYTNNIYIVDSKICGDRFKIISAIDFKYVDRSELFFVSRDTKKLSLTSAFIISYLFNLYNNIEVDIEILESFFECDLLDFANFDQLAESWFSTQFDYT